MIEDTPTLPIDQILGPLYFYGCRNEHGYLSQFYPVEFDHNGKKYCNLEQFFQVAKAVQAGDIVSEKLLLAETDPKKHKQIGKKVKPFHEGEWARISFDIVLIGNYCKFTKSKDADRLRALLLSTGERLIVEASPRDKRWGIGMGAAKADANRHKWGENMLGKALMEIRGLLERIEDSG